jgi:hypothetical protein
MEDYRAAIAGGATRNADPEALRALLAIAGVPTHWPFFKGVLADGLDHLWVADYELPHDLPKSWSVFAPDGAYLGRVIAPLQLDILAIGRSWVVARSRDRLGVESVSVYRLLGR